MRDFKDYAQSWDSLIELENGRKVKTFLSHIEQSPRSSQFVDLFQFLPESRGELQKHVPDFCDGFSW